MNHYILYNVKYHEGKFVIRFFEKRTVKVLDLPCS